jgi:hypothetical protein
MPDQGVDEILAAFESDGDARMDGELRPVAVPSDSPVYHYTNARGLKGIVDKDAIWLTERVHVNDPTELAYGLGFAIEWCDRQVDNDDLVTRVFFKQFRRGVDQLLDPVAAYVGSFSLRADILSQWCRYADDGRGFCLEFSPGFLGTQWNSHSDPGRVLAYLVDYRDDEIKRRQESCLERAREYIKRPEVVAALAHEPSRRELVVGMQALISYELLWNTLQFKHRAYGEEHEARVLLTGDAIPVRASAMHKTRVRGDEIVSYIELPFSPSIRSSGALRRLIVGPAASRETDLSVKTFLQSAGIDRVEVIRCDIPYRSTR